MSAASASDAAKPRPANAFKTLARLWPAAVLIPLRALIKGKRALGSVVAAGVTVDCVVPSRTLVRLGTSTLAFEPLH
jgi:hypothetical protein